jgi:hypothetical protein
MKRIFVSYSHRDKEFVGKLVDELEAIFSIEKVQLWIDAKIPPGTDWDYEIDRALKTSDIMILVISPDSMDSKHVQAEFRYFLDKQKPIIPIVLKQADDIHYRISLLQHVDFDSYSFENAFEILCSALHEEGITEEILEAQNDSNLLPSRIPFRPLIDFDNYIRINRNSIERFSPDTLQIIGFENQKDYEIAQKIFGDWPLLGSEVLSAWKVFFNRGIQITNNLDIFNQEQSGFPLFEGKMIRQFDPFFSPARYWIDKNLALEQNRFSRDDLLFSEYQFACRNVVLPTNERTCVAAILPRNSMATHTLLVGTVPTEPILLYFVSLLNSFCVEWISRLKITGVHFSITLMNSLPIPRLTSGNPHFDAIIPRAARLICTHSEFSGLWQEVMNEDWTEEDGVTDTLERQRLRDEIDAIVAHLYGLSSADFAYVLSSFEGAFSSNAGLARCDALLNIYDDFECKL